MSLIIFFSLFFIPDLVLIVLIAICFIFYFWLLRILFKICFWFSVWSSWFHDQSCWFGRLTQFNFSFFFVFLFHHLTLDYWTLNFLFLFPFLFSGVIPDRGLSPFPSSRKLSPFAYLFFVRKKLTRPAA